MNHGIKPIIVPVKDLAAAKGIYTALLGVEPYADAPYYVGFRVGEQDPVSTPWTLISPPTPLHLTSWFSFRVRCSTGPSPRWLMRTAARSSTGWAMGRCRSPS